MNNKTMNNQRYIFVFKSKHFLHDKSDSFRAEKEGINVILMLSHFVRSSAIQVSEKGDGISFIARNASKQKPMFTCLTLRHRRDVHGV